MWITVDFTPKRKEFPFCWPPFLSFAKVEELNEGRKLQGQFSKSKLKFRFNFYEIFAFVFLLIDL